MALSYLKIVIICQFKGVYCTHQQNIFKKLGQQFKVEAMGF